jgi:hypothetical protein
MHDVAWRGVACFPSPTKRTEMRGRRLQRV